MNPNKLPSYGEVSEKRERNPIEEILYRSQYSKLDMTEFRQQLCDALNYHVSHHSSVGSVWCKAGNINIIALIGRCCRLSETKLPIQVLDYSTPGKMKYVLNGEMKFMINENIAESVEWLDESASKPEIKLPEFFLDLNDENVWLVKCRLPLNDYTKWDAQKFINQLNGIKE